MEKQTKTKTQVYEVILETSDEEIDGENKIGAALLLLMQQLENEHIKNIVVNSISNEWGRINMERVVLNLTKDQAWKLNSFLIRALVPGNPAVTHGAQLVEIGALQERLDKTIKKHEMQIPKENMDALKQAVNEVVSEAFP